MRILWSFLFRVGIFFNFQVEKFNNEYIKFTNVYDSNKQMQILSIASVSELCEIMF